MAVKCQVIMNYIEEYAPKRLAEDWDNIGLQVGSPNAEISKVLVTLDITDQVVEEAINVGADMIVSHHPLFFKPLRNLRFDTPVGALINKIILNRLAVYCAHTNLDSAQEGVNTVLARKIGLHNIEVLNPDKKEELYKLAVFIPEGHADVVREAVTRAGAGWIGNYSDCTFSVNGIGTFKAQEGANPFIGTEGQLERTNEQRLETILPGSLVNKVVNAMLKAHPYEEVAYDLYPLLNKGKALGLGRIGLLEKNMTLPEFAQKVKKALGLNCVKIVGDDQAVISKVAVCGGSGGSLIIKAIFAGADVIVTGDVKYHEAQEAQALGISIVDAGHNGTEIGVLPEMIAYLNQCLGKNDVEVIESKINTDPFVYV